MSALDIVMRNHAMDRSENDSAMDAHSEAEAELATLRDCGRLVGDLIAATIEHEAALAAYREAQQVAIDKRSVTTEDADWVAAEKEEATRDGRDRCLLIIKKYARDLAMSVADTETP